MRSNVVIGVVAIAAAAIAACREDGIQGGAMQASPEVEAAPPSGGGSAPGAGTPAAKAPGAPRTDGGTDATDSVATADGGDASSDAPKTCSDLAVVRPVGALRIDDGTFGASTVDVHAFDRHYDTATTHTASLAIAFGATANECAIPLGGLVPQSMDELRVVIQRRSAGAPVPDFDVGTYDVTPPADPGAELTIQLEHEAGYRCKLADDPSAGFGGTAVSSVLSTGQVTITSRTASEVIGSFDVTTYDGKHYAGSFTAPLCAHAAVTTPTVCCKGP